MMNLPNEIFDKAVNVADKGIVVEQEQLVLVKTDEEVGGYRAHVGEASMSTPTFRSHCGNLAIRDLAICSQCRHF